MKRRTQVFLLSLVLSCLITTYLASAVQAHFSVGAYIYNNTRQQKDPVNLIYFSINYYDPNEPVGLATHQETIRHVVLHFNWNEINGSDMWFWEHSNYRLRDNQRNSCLLCPWQYHVPVKQGMDADPGWGIYSAAAAHIDEYRMCLHVATDFDGIRDTIQRGMHDQAPIDHPWRDAYSFANNTSPSPQCDGSMPRSFDGNVAWQMMGTFLPG